MSALLTRLVVYLFLPATLGGALAWATRSGPAARRSQPSPTPPRPAVLGRAAFGKNESAPAADSSLSVQRAFCERLRGATLVQMQEMLTETGDLTPAFRQQAIREIILDQMARTDPKGTLEWLDSDNDPNGDCCSLLLQSWARLDPDATADWVVAHHSPESDFMAHLFMGLLPDDPKTAARFIPKLTWGSVMEPQVQDALKLIAGNDPENAASLVGTMSKGVPQNYATNAVAEGWARKAPDAAYAWAKALTDPVLRETALRGVFSAWAESDPQGVAAKLGELAPEGAEGMALARGRNPTAAIARAWAAQDPKAAAAWLRSRPAASYELALNQNAILRQEILSTRDEWSAADLAGLLRTPGEPLVTTGQAAPFNSGGAWSNGWDSFWFAGDYGGPTSPLNGGGHPGDGMAPRLTDPAKAFDELAAQPADATRQHILQEAAWQWVEKDPAATLDRLKNTTDDWLKVSLVNALMYHASQTLDPALASQLPGENEMLKESRNLLFENIAIREPDRARTLLEGDLDSASKTSLATAIAREQAVADPAGAIAWAARLADGNMQESATQAAVASWSRADAYAVSEWLATQPAGPLHDAAVSGLLVTLKQTSPAEAFRWAETIADPARREEQQVGILSHLALRDREKARQAAAALTLSPARQAEVNRFLKIPR